MNEKVALNFLGLAHAPLQQNCYSLLLVEANGEKQLSVDIGELDARMIAAYLQKAVHAHRPLVHDLMTTLSKAYGIALKEVFLHRCDESGIYQTEMVFSDGEREIHFDARASDAIALALRLQAPIFTTPEIMEERGYIPQKIEISLGGDNKSAVLHVKRKPLNECSVKELQALLQRAIDREAYEQAALIKKEIDARNIV